MTRVPKNKCGICTGNGSENLCDGHQTRYTRGLRGKALAAPLRKYEDNDPNADKSISERLQYLRKSNKSLEQQIAEYQDMLSERQEVVDAIKSAVVAAQPLPKKPYKQDKSALIATQPVIPVLKFSDWHIGEKISHDETEGFGEYNWEIAQRRAHEVVSAFLRWVNTLRHGYKIHECVISCEGDYISGDIHDELRVTNEFPIPVQTAKAGLLLGELVTRIAAEFKAVTIYQVGADNHGRLTKKPQSKQKFQNSMSYLVNAIAEAVLAKHDNVDIVVAQGMKYVASIAGFKFLIEHGDTTKAWMGIPYYGIERSRAREAVKRMNTDKNFHYQSIAHWHVPAWISSNIIINGSLSGTSEFDHGQGRFAAPAQVAFMVHPVHGVFNFVPFKAE
jgi:hypothetical protein